MNQKTKSYFQRALILLLWISMVCVAYFQLIYKPEPNIDEVLFKIEMNGIQYNIPGRYTYMQTLELYGSWPSAKKERTKERVFEISVILPDMKPYFAEDDALWKPKGFGNKITATLNNTRDLNTFSTYKKFIKKNNPTESVPYEYGLEKFVEDNGSTVYFKKGDDSDLSINCYKEREDKDYSSSCRMESKYKQGLSISYSFDSKKINQWKEIDEKIKSIFESFEYHEQQKTTNGVK